MRRFLVMIAALVLALLPCTGSAQTAPVEIDDVVLELPAGWQAVPLNVRPLPFKTRGDARLLAAYRPNPAPAPVPFILLERMDYNNREASYAEVDTDAYIERVNAYYRSAFNVPLQSVDPGSWQKADLGPVRFDAATRTFRFYVDATFASHPGMYHVEVVGTFSKNHLIILSTWCDSATRPTVGETIHNVADSFRLTRIEGSLDSIKQSAIRMIKWVVGLAVLTLVVIQVYVLIHERRERERALRRALGEDA